MRYLSKYLEESRYLSPAEAVSQIFVSGQIFEEYLEVWCRVPQDAGGKMLKYSTNIWGGVPSSPCSYIHSKYLGFASNTWEGHPSNPLKYLEGPL